MLQSKAGYIDARPHIRQLGEIFLQRTAGPYIGSNASHRPARDVAAMSASHPITTELVRHNEPALRANKRHRAIHSITSSAMDDWMFVSQSSENAER